MSVKLFESDDTQAAVTITVSGLEAQSGTLVVDLPVPPNLYPLAAAKEDQGSVGPVNGSSLSDLANGSFLWT